MNYVFYLHAAAGTLDASTAPFVFLLNLAGSACGCLYQPNYIFCHPANKITSQSWSLVLTAATAKLGILIEFLFGWLLNLAALTPIAPAAGFDVCF
ncbi:MAG: hypothetical protein MR469_08940 [Campylobacter sp.]|uniref:hypothetical protein n=1 Tax=Campylobacter sp. TaxID=205 RepID=UPI002AA63F82|nr:hypothetical protein [Campylobacter sp.]MCI6695742.1 hypothetical protein [Campylobacter sp.]